MAAENLKKVKEEIAREQAMMAPVGKVLDDAGLQTIGAMREFVAGVWKEKFGGRYMTADDEPEVSKALKAALRRKFPGATVTVTCGRLGWVMDFSWET